MKKFIFSRDPPALIWGRFFFVLPALACAALLILPSFGIAVDVVLSGSMEPAVKTGSVIFSDTNAKKAEIGDVITFRSGNMLVTHRIISIKNGQYVTKGDANTLADSETVLPSQVIGVVMGSLPFVGYLIMFLKRKTVFALLLIMLLQEFLLTVLKWKGERNKGCAEN